MKKKILILSIAIVTVAAIGLGAFGLAEAATPGLPALQANGWGPALGHPHGEKGDGPLRPYVQAASAEILGMTVDELEAAQEEGIRMAVLIEDAGLTVEEFRTAMEAALPGIVEQALADNAITEAQAELILENGLMGPYARFGVLHQYVLEAAAEILGMDVDELQAALESGTTMGELLDEAGLTRLQFRQALDDATPGIVRAALANGAITEEQAERILEYGLSTGPCGSGRHERGGPGGPMGPGGMNGPGGFSGPNG
jgi:hypothetical protein